MTVVFYIGSSGSSYWQRQRNRQWKKIAAPGKGPVHVVTDLAEETLTEVDVPRLFGSDRQAFINRALTSKLAETPYRSAITLPGAAFLGPSRVLLIGVAAAETIDREIEQAGLCVRGIWPMSLLMQHYLGRKELPSTLIAALPGPSGLRLVVRKNGIPVLSRLVDSPPEHQAEEIIRTRRYLENARLFERPPTRYPTLILASNEHQAMLRAPLEAAGLDLIAPSRRRGGTPEHWIFPLFDRAHHAIPGQVAPLARRTDYLAGRVRQAAWGVTTLALLAGLTAGSENLLSLQKARTEKQAYAQQSAELGATIASMQEGIAAFGVAPEQIRLAVALEETELAHPPRLLADLQQLARVIESVPHARLDALTWRLSDAGEAPCAAGNEAPTGQSTSDPDISPGTAGLPARRHYEWQLTIAMPTEFGPRALADSRRKIDAALAALPGARIVRSASADQANGILRGGVGKQERSKDYLPGWCLTLPWPSPPGKPVPTTAEVSG